MLRTNPALAIAGILFLGIAFCATAADENGPVPRPPKWDVEKADIVKNAVKRETDAYPLSDQKNTKGWVKFTALSDEFEGAKLDEAKWFDRNPQWLGRQPGFFHPGNVAVKDGKLQLTMKAEEVPEMPKDKGYNTFTCAAVKSKTTVLYGYFEVMAKPMNSAGSSSFWFYNSTPELWTEIDVYELCGKHPGHEKKLHMNLHVFRTPHEKEHWRRGGVFRAPMRLAEDYHVYGLEWDEKEIKYYLDGVLVMKGPNTHWHQPLTMNFDSETMPEWFGLPKVEDLPSTYKIEYVRAWKCLKPKK